MHVKAAQTFAQGLAFWRIILTSGHAFSQLDGVDWHDDLVSTGDVARIAEIWLHTPAGDVALKVVRPRSAYMFHVGLMSMEGRSSVAQVIGRVDEPETGVGVAFIWDVAEQRVYQDDQASVHSFAAWRPGVCAPGALSCEALGVKIGI